MSDEKKLPEGWAQPAKEKLTMLDYFAAAALAVTGTTTGTAETKAQMAYQIAEAMLAEKAKRHQT